MVGRIPSWVQVETSKDISQQVFKGQRTGTLLPLEEFENWLDWQTSYAFESLIHNIGGYGGPDEALRGIAIASPSRNEPDYYYQWTRDSAIAASILVLSFADAYNETIRSVLQDYVKSCAQIQRTDNPSGSFADLNGLGEPKFLVNGSVFTGSWGRPQRDGPALRAISVMNFITTELMYDGTATYEDFRDVYFNVIKPDLEYTAQKWHLSGFDLWEEIDGMHFFTLLVQQRALSLGADFSLRLGDVDSSNDYYVGSETILAFLSDNFWSEQQQHLIETLHPRKYGRSGLDSAILLGSLHVLKDDYSSEEDFEPYSDKVIATLYRLIEDMQTRYPINLERLRQFEGYSSLVGVGIGRYPEDNYDGLGRSWGNPWFISTSAVAQTVYTIANYLQSQDEWFLLNTTERPLISPFFNQFINGSDFVLSRSDPEYAALVNDLLVYGDSFMDVMREHVSLEGDMSEQFSRWNGYLTGAEKLTWSYGSLWVASRERSRLRSKV